MQSSNQSSKGSTSPKKKKNSTVMSTMGVDPERKKQLTPGEKIAMKINNVFSNREQRMANMIYQAIFDDKLSVYKRLRKEHDTKISELDKEKVKIQKRKKNRKEKMKALRQNTKEKLLILCLVIKNTYKHYQGLYFESDHYRNLKLLQLAGKILPNDEKKSQSVILKKDDASGQAKQGTMGGKKKEDPSKKAEKVKTPKTSSQVVSMKKNKSSKESYVNPNMYANKKFINQLYIYMKSPFKDDIKFGVHYMMILTRDKLGDAEDSINKIFYEAMFGILMYSKDETNKHRAFETISNIVDSDVQRHKLVKEGCFRDLFEKMFAVADSKEKEDTRILEKLAVLMTKICFHQDLWQLIINQKLMGFILKICDQKYSNTVRSNAVLAISLLTYNDKLFDEIIAWGVIDLIMELCQDQNQDIVVQQFSTLALVHFALNERSLNIIIEKGVLDLFDTFGSNKSNTTNEIISTNISWIFVALCKSGITGNRMLVQGITRDMFLVSCNPDYQQIRHLVITGFGELGKFDFKLKSLTQTHESEKQTIKEISIVGMDAFFIENAQRNIDILLNFSMSDSIQYQYTAFWALKDYILLSSDSLVKDISKIVQAFIIGCIHEESKIQTECANALSFLVTHRLVYQSKIEEGMSEEDKAKLIEEIRNAPVEYILDAIMHLSGNKQKSIGTTAFSILSSLSKYTSQCKTVMAQISRDIAIPENLTSKNHHEFILKRLQEQKEKVYQEKSVDMDKEQFTGLYSLLRLSQEPSDMEIDHASDLYVEFIQKPYDPTDWRHVQNENYFLKVFKALKHSSDPKILIKLLKVIKFYINLDQSQIQLQIISPDTILWMLGIIEVQHKNNQKYLSCLCSSTLLQIVSKHEILFDYQEVAIIRKFNLALQNIDVFDQGAESPVEEPLAIVENNEIPELDEPMQTMEDKKQSQSISTVQEFQSIRSSMDMAAPSRLDSGNAEEVVLNNTQLSGATAVEQSRILDSILTSEKKNQERPGSQMRESLKLNLDETILNNNEASGLDAIADCESPSYIDRRKAQLLKKLSVQMSQKFSVVKSQSQAQDSQQENSQAQPDRKTSMMNARKLMPSTISKAQKNSNVDSSSRSKSTKRHKKPLMSRSSTKEFIIEQSLREGSPTKSSKPQSSKPQSPTGTDDEDTEEIEKVSMRDIGPNDHDLIDSHLRDSLIKAFMVIFTNEKSQHLLLNKDLIDIAFNCLEFCNECTLEAKRHVSRLISIIFKFPQVQKRMMGVEVVQGIGQLLNLHKHKDIIRYTIKACTYISMNYEFIKSATLSVDILKEMLLLLESLPDKNDQTNIIMTIKNIIKGDKVNKQFFVDNQGVQKLSKIILNSQDKLLVEMSIQSFAEIASYKKTMKQIISEDDGTLLQIFEKCVNISQDWARSLIEHDQMKKNGVTFTGITSQSLMSDDSKQILIMSENESPEAKERFPDQESKFDYSIDESQIEIPEFMQNDLDQLRAINNFKRNPLELQKVTRSLKLRNSMYYLIARALKFGFDPYETLERCSLIDCILSDLSNFNCFIFPNLMLIMQNLKVAPEAVQQLIGNNIDQIITQMYQIPQVFNFFQESLLKVVLELIQLQVQELSKNPRLFQIVFGIPQDQRSNEKMVELVLWQATSLCEQKIYNENFDMIVQYMMQFEMLDTITQCLDGTSERLILQALILLSQTAQEEVVRLQIFEYEGLMTLLQTLNERSFAIYNIEIHTALSETLGQVSSQKNRLRNISGLNSNLINQALQKQFNVKRNDVEAEPSPRPHDDDKMNLHTIEEQVSKTQLDHDTYSSKYKMELDEPVLITTETREDDIERIKDENRVVEKLIQTIANLTLDQNLHEQLIENGVVKMIKKYVDYLISKALPHEADIDMEVFPIIALDLVQSLSEIILNISQNSWVIKKKFAEQDILPVVLKCYKLKDYKVRVNLMQSMACMITSDEASVRNKCVGTGVLQKMLEELQLSNSHKIKRIAMDALTEVSQIDQSMFEMNDKLQLRLQQQREQMNIQ